MYFGSLEIGLEKEPNSSLIPSIPFSTDPQENARHGNFSVFKREHSIDL